MPQFKNRGIKRISEDNNISINKDNPVIINSDGSADLRENPKPLNIDDIPIQEPVNKPEVINTKPQIQKLEESKLYNEKSKITDEELNDLFGGRKYTRQYNNNTRSNNSYDYYSKNDPIFTHVYSSMPSTSNNNTLSGWKLFKF